MLMLMEFIHIYLDLCVCVFVRACVHACVCVGDECYLKACAKAPTLALALFLIAMDFRRHS